MSEDFSFDDQLDEERDDVLCPECDEPMVVRRNKLDGSQFYGCSNYPTCKRTLPLDFDEPSGSRIPWGQWDTVGEDYDMEEDVKMHDIFGPES